MRDQENVLIVSPNWIGDVIMSMPAVQRFRRPRPDAHLAVLAKPSVAPLWRMHAAPDTVHELPSGPREPFRTGFALRRARYDTAYIVPHSFRAVFAAWSAGVPRRVGLPGGLRDRLLTCVVRPRWDEDRTHQRFEIMDLFGAGGEGEAEERPDLHIPAEKTGRAEDRFGVEAGAIAVMPGAARGVSKRWPAEHFARAAERLAADGYDRFVIFGASADREAGERIVARLEDRAVNLAGRTSLEEWAALLSRCRLALANDSGGMHLAAALGVPLVAVYGLTDPGVTGPVGPHCRLVRPGGTAPNAAARDIDRDDTEAAQKLASIAPETVYHIAAQLLRETSRSQ